MDLFTKIYHFIYVKRWRKICQNSRTRNQKTGKKAVETKFCLYPKQTRYLKIVFENYEIIPDGRQGRGNVAWLFVDEIVIN